MDSVSPNFYVKNINETVEFYKLLGFQAVAHVPEEGEPIFVMMVCGQVTFMFQTFDSLNGELPQIKLHDEASLLLYIQIKGIRDFFEKIKDKVKLIKGIEVTFYGATEFSIQDNNGYILTFAEDEK